MMLRRAALVGIIAASVCWAPYLEAQAFDSLSRPRPLLYPERPAVTRDTTRICIDYCGGRRVDKAENTPAYRIVGADGQLLFMSSPDTASAARATEATTAIGSVEPSQIVNIEVVKGATVATTYGKSYVNGLIIITLDRKGTEAWRSAAAARAAKPGAAAPPP